MLRRCRNDTGAGEMVQGLEHQGDGAGNGAPRGSNNLTKILCMNKWELYMKKIANKP